ncbi:MAG: HD domain-containing protein [Bacteroidales bacterium]|nr:HD domain-containing protein [Candidatus Liminaster caballi]
MIQPDKKLRSFIEEEIIPRYASFDKAHQEDHVHSVIEQSLKLAPFYDVSIDMVYAIAAYHDLGLEKDRKTHHLVSGQIVMEDERLLQWFSHEQIETMAKAVEDHRASSDHEPRSIYGKIVAEADRLIDTDTILRRTIQYGFKHYPDFGKEAHIKRALDHLDEKYAEGGYLRLWIPESPNAERLKVLQQLIKQKAKIRELIELVYEQVKSALL